MGTDEGCAIRSENGQFAGWTMLDLRRAIGACVLVEPEMAGIDIQRYEVDDVGIRAVG